MYLQHYIDGNYTELNNVINVKTLPDITNDILSIDTTSYPCLEELKNSYVKVLATIQGALNSNTSYLNALAKAEVNQEAANILHNSTLLKKYLDEQNKQKLLFTTETQLTVLPQINPVYLRYIELYGIPTNRVFDPIKLNELMK